MQYCCTGIFNKRSICPWLWSIMIISSIKDNTKKWIFAESRENRLNLILHFVGVVSPIITNSNYSPITFIYVVSKHKLKTKVFSICDALRDLVAFVQFKKREKHLWRSVTFSKVSGCFSRFLNCTNATKSSKASHLLFQKVTGSRW